MEHNFNTTVAKVYGVEESIILHNMYFWIEKNRANNKHCYDGRYWTYNSINAFSELFPYWTNRQITRILNSLKEQKAIIVGNYNQVKYDRTMWYAITEIVYSIYANGEMDLPKTSNGFTENVTPIPDSKPDINTDSKTYNNIIDDFENHFELLWQLYHNKKGKSAITDKTKKQLLNISVEQMTEYIEKYKKILLKDTWRCAMDGSTWFNGRWKDYIEDNLELNPREEYEKGYVRSEHTL